MEKITVKYLQGTLIVMILMSILALGLGAALTRTERSSKSPLEKTLRLRQLNLPRRVKVPHI
jgi:hypothetical protein